MQHQREESGRLYENSFADVVWNEPQTHEAVASKHGGRIWLLPSATLSLCLSSSLMIRGRPSISVYTHTLRIQHYTWRALACRKGRCLFYKKKHLTSVVWWKSRLWGVKRGVVGSQGSVFATGGGGIENQQSENASLIIKVKCSCLQKQPARGSTDRRGQTAGKLSCHSFTHQNWQVLLLQLFPPSKTTIQ